MTFLKSIERNGKRLLIRAISLILPKQEQVNPEQLRNAAIKKVLIIRLEQKLGNMVMTTIIPRAIKEMYDEADIDILVHSHLTPVWENNPFVRLILEFNHVSHLVNPFRLLNLIISIRKTGYDVALDCSNPAGFSLSNGLFTRMSGATYQVGFKRGNSDLMLNVSVTPDLSKHYIDIIIDLLSVFRQDIRRFEPEIFITDEEKSRSMSILENYGVENDSKVVVIWVGARFGKQWNIEHFRDLGSTLESETGSRCLYLCGPEEKRLFDYLTGLEIDNVLNVSDLRTLACIIDRCDLFISGDAGPLHLAVALNKSTVGIFLVNNVGMYGYDNCENHRVADLTSEPEDIEKVKKVCREIFQLEPQR